MNRKHIKKALVISILLIFMVGSFGIDCSWENSAINIQTDNIDKQMNSAQLSTFDVKILFLMDDDYGANYHYIRPILEGYGWNVTIAGTDETLTPCNYQNPSAILEVDLLISEVDDIEEYDAISIMPGNSHTGLIYNDDALNLLKDANAAGLVISAWCRAVRVLAYADIIDGKDVSGHSDYADEYTAAGANYIPDDPPPIIDGNIVTTTRSRFYRTAMCQAIATALGVFETDAPVVSGAFFDPEVITPLDNFTLMVNITDASAVNIAEAIFYTVDPTTGERNTSVATYEVDLENVEGDVYSVTLDPLSLGNYTVNIDVRDIFGNHEEYEDVILLSVVNPTSSTDMTMIILVGGIGAVAVVIVIAGVFLKRR